jgi:hypothetical protein
MQFTTPAVARFSMARPNQQPTPSPINARQGTLHIRQSALETMMKRVPEDVTQKLEAQAAQLTKPFNFNAMKVHPATTNKVTPEKTFSLNAGLLALGNIMQASAKTVLGNPTQAEPIQILTPEVYSRVAGQYHAPNGLVRTVQIDIKRSDEALMKDGYTADANVLEHSALGREELVSLYKRMGKAVPPRRLQPQVSIPLNQQAEAHTAKVLSNIYGLEEGLNDDFFRTYPKR